MPPLMPEQQENPLTKSGYVIRRLLVTFLPHAPVVLAMVVCSTIYAATMTGRVALAYPMLRIFVEEASDEVKEKLGGDAVVRTLTQSGESRNPMLKKVDAFLDSMDSWFIATFNIQGNATHRAQVATLATVTLLFLIISLFAAISNFGQMYFRSLLVVRILVSLRVKLLTNLLDQPLAFYNEQKRGELITRMSNDVTSATVCLQTMTGPIVQQPLLLIGPMWILMQIRWWFVFVMVFFLTGIMMSVRRQAKKVHRRARVRQRTIGRVTESMVQMFSGIRVVKAFGLEKAKVAQYTTRNQEFARDAMATDVTKAWTRAKMELITNLTMVLVTFVAAVVIGSGGSMPPDIMLMFVIFMAQMYRPSKVITRAYTDIVDHLAGAGRVFEFMDLRSSGRDKPGAVAMNGVTGDVRFWDVSFAYNGSDSEDRVLDHINLDVKSGQVVALVGHSGAGKSTLVNLVPRFYDPDAGMITIDGTDIREFKRESLLQNIAIVTQEPFLFNTSVRENIAYGRANATHEQVEDAARAAYIHEFIETLPRGYDTIVGERGANFSGGQCQRVTIARALLRDPKILILDEATSSLDTESEHAVQEALTNLMEGRTTLVIAHRLSTIQHADKICVMAEGKIVEIGSHEELMGQKSVYRRLYQLQFGDTA